MEVEMDIEPVFEVREVDPDYEFEAGVWFDFTREESIVEAVEAESWFQSAKSYPPSPFIVKLVLPENVLQEKVSTATKLNDEVKTTGLLNDDSNNGPGHTFSATDSNNRDCGERRGIFTNLQSSTSHKVMNQASRLATGLTVNTQSSSDVQKGRVDSRVKPRSSTLMKPTASQLAKQNNSRFQTLPTQNKERNLCNGIVVESQAAKRQKLEGGLLRKVTDTMQQINLVHKPPKKDDTPRTNSTHTRMKITIPREPHLETTHRAHMIQPKRSTQLENVPSVVRRFKARPLNRKILEAPSLPLPKKSTPRLPEFQEFHLKTSERAVHHSSAVLSTTIQCNDCEKGSEKPITNTSNVVDEVKRENKRQSAMDGSKQNYCELKYNFKARPVNKKILSSKGNIGVYRNRKKETTIPMEFHLGRDKRAKQHLPIDLFSKLSLTSSEPQPTKGTDSKVPQATSIHFKGSKENRLNYLPAGNQVEKDKPPPSVNDGCDSDASHRWVSRRSLGIR